MTQPVLYHEHLARMARREPNGLALVDNHTMVTNRELVTAMQAVSGGLARRGVNLGDRVAMAMTPSAAYAALILGAFERGAVAVPVNTRLSTPELRAFAEPIEPKFIVCDLAHREQAEATGYEVVVLERSDEDAGLSVRLDPVWSTAPAPADFGEDHPALIIGTGGTTGLPKGAWIDHRGLWLWSSSLLWNEIRARRDVELFFSAFFHISIITGWMSTLFTGGTVRILERFDVERALRSIDTEATTMLGAATMYAALHRDPGFETIDRSRVRQVNWGGMASSAQFVRERIADYPNARLASSYAATEFGVVVRSLHEDFLAGRLTGIGRPLVGVLIRIVDADGNELPNGEVGEIAVTSPWQMRGYWGLEEETRATWQPCGVRLGDLGWRGEDGWLYMSGRKKEMIVSGGENVFPAEVEVVLARHPSVMDVVVYGAHDDFWGERVEAAVVLNPGTTLTRDALAEFARGGLAGYKLPKQIRILDAIPLTANRKPDRRALVAAAEEEAPTARTSGSV
jgi:fatty-acyl-CoA synthase